MDSFFSDYTEFSSGQIAMRCPFCNSEGQKLSINPKTKAFICFKCDKRGWNIDEHLPMFKYYVEDSDFDLDFTIFDQGKKKLLVKLDDKTEPIYDFDVEFFYLQNRGLTLSDVQTFDLRKGIGKYHGSIFIPVYDSEGDPVYYLRRVTRSSSKLRYIDPSGYSKLGILANYHVARSYNRIFLTEGWFTGKALGNNFVAQLGKMTSDKQAIMLALFQDIFYCPDSDVKLKEVKKNINTILKYRSDVWFVKVPKNRGKIDAEDLSLVERQYMISNSFYIDKFTLYDLDDFFGRPF